MAFLRDIRLNLWSSCGLGLALSWPAPALAQAAAFEDAPPAAPSPQELAPEQPAPPPETAPAAEPAPRPAPAPAPSPVWAERLEESKNNIPSAAPEPRGPGKPFRLFGALTHTAYGGKDFNGGGLLFLPSANNEIDTTLVPAFGSGTGFLVGMGFGVMPSRAGRAGVFIDVTYGATWLSPHSVLVEGSLGQSVFHQINVPMRVLYRVSRYLAPYMEAGLGGGWVNVSGVHGYVNLASEMFEVDGVSSHFGGMTMGIGVGSFFMLTDYLGLDGFVGYNTFVVTSLKDIPLEEEMTAPNWTFRLGPAFFL